LTKGHGKAFDIKGFAEAFGDALNPRGFADAFRSALDLNNARKSFAAGFRGGADLLIRQIPKITPNRPARTADRKPPGGVGAPGITPGVFREFVGVPAYIYRALVWVIVGLSSGLVVIFLFALLLPVLLRNGFDLVPGVEIASTKMFRDGLLPAISIVIAIHSSMDYCLSKFRYAASGGMENLWALCMLIAILLFSVFVLACSESVSPEQPVPRIIITLQVVSLAWSCAFAFLNKAFLYRHGEPRERGDEAGDPSARDMAPLRRVRRSEPDTSGRIK
jgi:hypothetical protein